ncbi:hypothetical protein BU25DRAFT_449256 [Macroventuria anomochaeta]|uniref:Uncharacterized protein n=1 Tax=Macroventuria anomochaeta TaxID=301207 RepID=A0ACB6RZX8_9PLEO|nr:uncharacterized protein BU25DRAFT_449256 [Macroventuria anomochaeta]KAF2626714.1 hypothetical protein BU25DRAFT_449256 [Macroventuria anomochaeta]
MVFEAQTAHNIGKAWFVLASDDAAKAAIRDLHGAPLFDRRIRVSPYEKASDSKAKFNNFYWGWTASKDPRLANAKIRGPHLRPPKDIFRSIRQGRRVAIDMPRSVNHHPGELYALFHNYNIDSMGDFIEYRRKSDSGLRSTIMLDFTTREEADKSVHVFDEHKFKGMVLQVRKWQLPLKHLGGTSWDGGRPGIHYSGRDQGNAAGTNFEHVSFPMWCRLSSMHCVSRDCQLLDGC